MESLVNPSFWRDKSVLVTGHTGFKGGWLAAWLTVLGARVTGFALPPPTTPSLFEAIGLDELIDSHIGDIRDPGQLRPVFESARPEVVLHLAAQSLVLESYSAPAETYATNVVGTANVLDCARYAESVRACVVIATDKCYENREWVWGYREEDTLGGADPYSSSKACAELVVDCYRRSFFTKAARLASARAGNVIGGGDWSKFRLLPDLVRAAATGEPILLRHPGAIRPWQHVLDPLRGYLAVAERLYREAKAASAWNFGPEHHAGGAVRDVVARFAEAWGEAPRVDMDPDATLHESRVLRLDSSKARIELGWHPLLQFEEAVDWAVRWYKEHHLRPSHARDLTFEQIDQFSARS